MRTEKTTNATAESLNSAPTTEQTKDKEDLYNGIIHRLFEEAVEELAKQPEAEQAEERKALARFAELVGCQERSPYAMMYAGFRVGVATGFSLAARRERNA